VLACGPHLPVVVLSRFSSAGKSTRLNPMLNKLSALSPMKTRLHFGLGLLAFAALWVYARAQGQVADNAPLHVATLNTVLTEIAREVGGDRVHVQGLVRPGVDPHAFDPSSAELRVIATADVIFASGLNLETYLEKIAKNSSTPGRLFRIGEQLPHILSLSASSAHDGHTHGSEELSSSGEPDPHWWHSIDNVLFAADLVRAEYTRLRPDSGDFFASNAQRYQQRLFALKGWAGREIARIPPARRILVTSHDAFGYFARDYGFAIHPISGLSTDEEPNAKDFAALVTFIQ
jgi:zinc/manganese transport system substrate-binding protein